ncbi:MAG: hypothetical protein JXQ97_08630 [Natronospirillum sp.]
MPPETSIKNVKRESGNIDLSFSHGEGDDTVDYIIELKVKSLPHIGQLADYAKKHPKAEKLLIHAITGHHLNRQLQEFHEANPKIKGWRLADLTKLETFYIELAKKATGYHGYLFADYAQALSVINGVGKQIEFTMHQFRQYGFQDDDCNDKLKLFRDLRVHDLYLKGCYELMANDVIRHLNGNGIKAKYGQKLGSLDLDAAHVATGMTRGQGLLDISITIAPDLYAGIQIQDYAFRYFVEVRKERLGKHEATLLQLRDLWFERMEALSPSPLIPRDNEKVLQYSHAFLYRYFKIPDLFVDSIGLRFDELYSVITLSVKALLEFRKEAWEEGIVNRPIGTDEH